MFLCQELCTVNVKGENAICVSVSTGSAHREGQNLPPRDSPSSHRLQHSHSDLSPHHSLDSASMSPLFDQQPQQHSQTGLSQSRHGRSVTADQLSWPRGSNQGQEGGGGRRGDWGGMHVMAGSEPDLLARRLRVDVILPVSNSTGNCSKRQCIQALAQHVQAFCKIQHMFFT